VHLKCSVSASAELPHLAGLTGLQQLSLYAPLSFTDGEESKRTLGAMLARCTQITARCLSGTGLTPGCSTAAWHAVSQLARLRSFVADTPFPGSTGRHCRCRRPAELSAADGRIVASALAPLTRLTSVALTLDEDVLLAAAPRLAVLTHLAGFQSGASMNTHKRCVAQLTGLTGVCFTEAPFAFTLFYAGPDAASPLELPDLSGHSRLRRLRISGKRIREQHFSAIRVWLAPLTRLQHLALCDFGSNAGQLAALTAGLSAMRELSHLTMRGVGLTSACASSFAPHFGNLTALVALDLSGNRTLHQGGAGLGALLAALPQLTRLALAGSAEGYNSTCHEARALAPLLPSLPQLQHLDLSRDARMATDAEGIGRQRRNGARAAAGRANAPHDARPGGRARRRGGRARARGAPEAARVGAAAWYERRRRWHTLWGSCGPTPADMSRVAAGAGVCRRSRQ
jgi:hypothetical protein